MGEQEQQSIKVKVGEDDIRMSTGDWDGMPIDGVDFTFDQDFVNALKQIQSILAQTPNIKNIRADLPGWSATYKYEGQVLESINKGPSESLWVESGFVVYPLSKNSIELQYRSKYAGDDLLSITISLPESL